MSSLLPLLTPSISTKHKSTCAWSGTFNRCCRCDLLLDLPIFHLTAAVKGRACLVREVESCDPVTVCPSCGVIAIGHGRIVPSTLDARRSKGGSTSTDSAAQTPLDLPRATLPDGHLRPWESALCGSGLACAIRWAARQLRREGATNDSGPRPPVRDDLLTCTSR
jgi:hypothetical protein